MSHCTDRCLRPTPFQAHCSQCHRHFGGVKGFDRHRVNGHCIDPGAFGHVERDGIWREPMDHNKVAMFRARVEGKR